MSDLISCAPAIEHQNFDAARIAEVKSWLASQFEAAGRTVPKFEYTARSVDHLHALSAASQASTHAAHIATSDLRLKASDYCSQAARIREILENVGLAQQSLSPGAIATAQVLANVANLVNLRDTEMSSFLVAMGDISLRKISIEEKRDEAKKESEVLLDRTRKAIAKLTILKKTLQKLDDEVAICEAQMLQSKKNLALMVSKERQYKQQLSNYKDKALAALVIENKRRQFAVAEKYLEEVLHSALTTSE